MRPGLGRRDRQPGMRIEGSASGSGAISWNVPLQIRPYLAGGANNQPVSNRTELPGASVRTPPVSDDRTARVLFFPRCSWQRRLCHHHLHPRPAHPSGPSLCANSAILPRWMCCTIISGLPIACSMARRCMVGEVPNMEGGSDLWMIAWVVH